MSNEPTIKTGDRVTLQPPTFHDGFPCPGWPDPSWIQTVASVETRYGCRCLILEDRHGRRTREREASVYLVESKRRNKKDKKEEVTE